MSLSKKIDFKAYIVVENANPNGDPLAGNLPRLSADSIGEISDVCIKRKIRNRLLDMGENILVQSNDYKVDEYDNLKERIEANEELKVEMKKGKKADPNIFQRLVNEIWLDVRTFGQVFPFKLEGDKGVSISVRGPVSIHSAFSVDSIFPTTIQITKSVNNEPGKGKGSDTIGSKHRVDFGIYELKGSINVQLAEKTGFTDEDAEKVKEAIRTLFVNDASAARPEGSMSIHKLYWWTHNNKIGQYSTKKVHESIEIKKKDGITMSKSINDYEIIKNKLDNLKLDVYDGL